jgi:endonuclease/exonuclease/phosphatase family metal-dependent hydrolase
VRESWTGPTAVLAAALFVACAHAPRSADRVSLRVMTYNIEAGAGDLAATIAAIRAAAPDVVALQEVDVHWSARSAFADQATAIAGGLGMQSRFAHIYDLAGADPAAPRREYGVALLSRYPIVAWTNHAITRLSTQADDAHPAPMPGFLEVVLDVGGIRVRAFDTHLDYRPDPAVRRQQVAETLVIIGAAATPVLLFGDLNAPPTAPELQPLLQRLSDSWTSSSDPGLTYPAASPLKRIDYVLTSPHFTVRNAAVPDTRASDHRPVVVDLTLAGIRR